MRFRPGDLVFVIVPRVPRKMIAPSTDATEIGKFWGIVLGKPKEDSLGGLNYPVFRSDGCKVLTNQAYLRHPREVTPIYQGELDGNSPSGGDPAQ